MNQYLIEISIGPVQGFIAAARKTRDLWAGSYMLSEMVRAAGKCLLDRGATLIYPIPSRIQGDNSDQTSNLPNILLAKVQADEVGQVASLAQRVRNAAQEKLREYAREAWGKWTGAGVSLRKEFWERQIESAIECYAAWSLFSEDGSENAYIKTYSRLKATLASRKCTRDFEPMHTPQTASLAEEGIPKSSLDGLRESVLPKGRERFPLQFALSAGEQLDALGAVKRVVGRQVTFVALSRIAADPWIRSLSEDERKVLRDHYEPLVDETLATRTHGKGDVFPYDAGLLYPERIDIVLKEVRSDNALKTAEDHLKRLKKVLQPIWKARNRPCPYVAMILADGDRMGKCVDHARSLDHHANISRAVCRFSDKVPGLLRSHNGRCIYNGGDDVMGMLPLSGILQASMALAQEFDREMAPVVNELKELAPEDRPSLRIGVAICHILEPLGHIRRWTAEAEHYAKTGDAEPKRTGNALGLCLHIRSGHVVSLRLPFDDPEGFVALNRWTQAYHNNECPGRLVFDTAGIAQHLEAGLFPPAVAQAEWSRLLDRARQSGGKKTLPDDLRQELTSRLHSLGADQRAFQRLADELRVARWLSATTESDISAYGG